LINIAFVPLPDARGCFFALFFRRRWFRQPRRSGADSAAYAAACAADCLPPFSDSREAFDAADMLTPLPPLAPPLILFSRLRLRFSIHLRFFISHYFSDYSLILISSMPLLFARLFAS
jgi:hypothetical protein